LEVAFAANQGKRTVIYLGNTMWGELMWNLADTLVTNIPELLDVLR